MSAASKRASAIDWLQAEPAFREVASRLASMVELQAMVSASYPQSPLTVLSLSEDGTLAIAARNAAEAARLRQLEPTLVDHLRRRGAAVARLRIRTRRNPADAVRPPRDRHAPRSRRPRCRDSKRLRRVHSRRGCGGRSPP